MANIRRGVQYLSKLALKLSCFVIYAHSKHNLNAKECTKYFGTSLVEAFNFSLKKKLINKAQFKTKFKGYRNIFEGIGHVGISAASERITHTAIKINQKSIRYPLFAQ